jgi:hypothetical protein
MRILANENVPGDAVIALRNAGHDVSWARTDAPGSGDTMVLECAVREARVLLTFDKDFGELAWRARLPASCGIILLRIPMPPAGRAAKAIADIVSSRSDWPGNFAVVEPGRIRVRPLPMP